MRRSSSKVRVGRTIGEAREKLETANERATARKKDKRKKALRIVITTIGFATIVLLLVGLYFGFRSAEAELAVINSDDQPAKPSIEIVDEAAAATGGHLSTRMIEYVNQMTNNLRSLGLTAIRAVIPIGAIREIDFYLDGYTGFIKTTIDRGAGVTSEDTERMLRYLQEKGIADFTYIDVRTPGKAYWK